jgi:hypothetical protein
MNFVKYVCLDLHLLFGLFGLYLKLPNNSSKIRKNGMFEVKTKIYQECAKMGETLFPYVLCISVNTRIPNTLQSMCNSY